MKKIRIEQMNDFSKNSIKSLVVLSLSSLSFVILITIFPLIGSLTMDDFPILQVVKDNFKLLIPLLIVNLLISPLFGWASCKFRKKRIFYLMLIGIGGCWLAIIFVLLMWSNFTIINEFGSFLVLSAWALGAYSFFSFPILVPAIIIIERWTREK